jgi:23S rRNA (cytosine1962-C5)-methyltransferase
MAHRRDLHHESAMTARPRVRFRTGPHRRFADGHPWIFSNEIDMDAATKAILPGAVVAVETAGGDRLAAAHFNPHTLIAARALDRSPEAAIDTGWFRRRIENALALRMCVVGGDHFRLVNAEADGLPGLVIDRFGGVLVIQPNTAGMDAAIPDLVAALGDVVAPRAVVVRGDSAARALESLPERVECLVGAVEGAIEVHEGGLTYFADLLGGQKTGWFFDQRDNRSLAASLVRGLGPQARMLDLYTHTGGFAIACAVAGAASVTAIDSSASALALAVRAAKTNDVAARCKFQAADVFDWLTAADRGPRFDLVIADPPPFARSRKDIKPGLQGYRKLARLAAPLVAPGGLLMIASCSHHAAVADFTAAVARGLADSGRTGRLLRISGAGLDHPVHPRLPESAYLKTLTLALD